MLSDLLSDLPLNRRIYVHVDGAIDQTTIDVEKTKHVAKTFKAKNPSVSIKLLFQEKNLGNIGSFKSAMHWVFSLEDRIIMLEDDIRFNDAFFNFMDWTLENYKDSKRIFHINGLSVISFLPGKNRLFESYSCKPWGFGTWKTSWELYNQTTPLEDPKKLFLAPLFAGVNLTETFKSKWWDRFIRLNKGTDTYDLGWNYAAWANNACALAPRFTYTTNIGFDSRSLHTSIKPTFLRLSKKLRTRNTDFTDTQIVPFPSYYDAYSDFIEWGVPGIRKGSVRFLAWIYALVIKTKGVLRLIFKVNN
jgi:hypothetical protein